MKKSLKLVLHTAPKSKQSMRIGRLPNGRPVSFQAPEVKEYQYNLKAQAVGQLPKDFKPFDSFLKVKSALFVFPPLKSWNKSKIEAFKRGATIYKNTKPDLTDNLMKGVFDALNKVIFTDDAIVCLTERTAKIYGDNPRIELELEEIDEIELNANCLFEN